MAKIHTIHFFYRKHSITFPHKPVKSCTTKTVRSSRHIKDKHVKTVKMFQEARQRFKHHLQKENNDILLNQIVKYTFCGAIQSPLPQQPSQINTPEMVKKNDDPINDNGLFVEPRRRLSAPSLRRSVIGNTICSADAAAVAGRMTDTVIARIVHVAGI